MSETTLAPEAAGPRAEPRPSWLLDLVTTVDHKRIGLMYMASALLFLLVAGALALLIRVQLIAPRMSFLSPGVYNQLFTMHGTTMVFFFGMPALVGLLNAIVPLQIGARDVAFPRLNAFSFWMTFLSGLLLYGSFFVAGGAPAAGWFSYAPLSEAPFSLNRGQDYWTFSLLTAGVGSIAASLNLIVTVLRLRAPGLTLRRLPLFTWMGLIVSFLTVFTIAVLNSALVALIVDRMLGGSYFRPERGGSAVVWQHMFWAFGHPEVYILIIPAFGIVSEVIAVFSRRPIFGYAFVAGSTVLIALLSFGVWGHHMFAVGLGGPADAFFALMTMLIAVPTGVKVLNWTATLAQSAIRFTVAMAFVLGFLVQFTMGGITGVMFATYPLDWQLTDSYFVVAHFHYVLIGGTVFAFWAGAYYWFPKLTGRLLSERLGWWHFWLATIGLNGTFFVQHILGLMGMPRRVYTYPDLPGWGLLNLISSLGSFVFALGVLAFLANVVYSLVRGQVAGPNPWRGWTLEWATSSPPPEQNFDRVPPVRSRRPLYDLANPARPDWANPEAGGVAGATSPPPAVALPPPRRPASALATLIFLGSEALFFLVLIITLLFFKGTALPEQLAGADRLDPVRAGMFTAALVLSSGTLWLAERAFARGSRAWTRGWLATTVLLGAIFLAGQAFEYAGLYAQGVTVASGLFGTQFYTLTGVHFLHVSAGLVMLAILCGLALLRRPGQLHEAALRPISLYWHFVDVVWLVLFGVVYLGGW